MEGTILEILKMEILVARIPEEGSNHQGTEPSELLGLEGEDRFVRVKSDISYDFYVQRVQEELVVRGSLSVDLDLLCTRCAEFFSTTVNDSDFLRAYPVSKEVDSVDISEDMREDILLHIPNFPLCSDGCKGLCAQCGKDLNTDSCSCEKGEEPNPWTALDNLNL